MRRHDAACAVLADCCREYGCQVYTEVVLPTAHATRLGARMDLVVHSPAFSTPAYVDVTVVSALSAEALAKGSAHCAGVACSLAVQDKRASYPFLPVITFAIEDHGRFGDEALGFVRKVAPADKHQRARALQCLYQRLGATCQRIAADAVIAAMAR